MLLICSDNVKILDYKGEVVKLFIHTAGDCINFLII